MAEDGTKGRQRRPRGYGGARHMTIGSDISSVLAILKFPVELLGETDAARLRDISPSGWYPIEWLLDLMEKLDKELGQYGLLRMGRTLFKLSHEKRVLESAKSARDILYGLDAMYHFANRGERIGGWAVTAFEPGHAVLEKTTPHHCMMEQGLLSAALAAVGCPSSVEQPRCFRTGSDACVFEITSTVTDERWSGGTTS